MRRSLFASFFLLTTTLSCGLALTAARVSAAPLSTSLTADERRHLQRETLAVIEFLQGYHYSHRPLHELAADELLERYFHQLDPERRFFLRGDTEFLRRRFERNLKTVYLFKGDLHPAFEIYDTFAKRVSERCSWIEKRLGQPFAAENDGLLTADRSEEPRPANTTEAEALWEKILRNEWIQLRVFGHDDDAAVLELRRRYHELRQHVAAADPLRVRAAFLNELMQLFDPHSGYFSKETAEVVSEDLTGAITGIGVDLRAVEGRFLVKSLQPGGPAELQGELQPGDEFIAIGAPGSAAKPLQGLRLREVAELIRGKPGTRLALTVRGAGDDTPRIIELERSRLEIAENHASGFLFRVPVDGRTHTIGVISLPAFYGEADEGSTTASMTKDVTELLAGFSARGAEGVVVDLRDNGGGLIDEAVSLIGLFIEKGPALLTRGKSGAPTILRDDKPGVAFGGPLVVVTSRHSASASEGFAGAMQAYRRGLVVGHESTFGKGTMQSVIELGKTSASVPAASRNGWGMARVTRAFFYGPDGSSPQFDGVRSDVALPGFVAPGDIRENGLPHALPATRIPAPEPLDTTSTTVARLTPELLDHLKKIAAHRVASLPEFALEERANALRKEFWKTEPVSLNLTQRLRDTDDLTRRRIELRRERRVLDAEVAYSVERVDLEIVEKNRRNHQATLLARRTASGEPLANRLERDTYYYAETTSAELRRISVESFDWDVALAAAPELAAVWCGATGRASDDAVLAAVRATLTALKLRDADAPTSVPVATIFRQQLGAGLDELTLQRAIGAFLKAAAERDVDVLRDQPPLDVHLRESLRLAADWAHREGGKKNLSAHTP